jgi:hypothetical protein
MLFQRSHQLLMKRKVTTRGLRLQVSHIFLHDAPADAEGRRSEVDIHPPETAEYSVASEHPKRNYAKALDEVFVLCEVRQQPLSRALLMEYRAAMLEKNASTVNVRLSAVRKLIGEAQCNGIIGAEEAANLAGVPNPAPDLREALSQERRGSGTDQVFTWALP